MNDIKVSICCITYNHEKFIAQALDGFLMQKTDFNFEIIIHDDASTDKTQSIISEYAKKDSRIIPILRKNNIKSTGVPIFPITYEKASGQYIAICEGDDYWINPYKLQKQVEFLNQNNDYGLVFTDCSLLYMDSNRIVKSRYKNENIYVGDVFDKLIIKNYISTPTVCVKKKLLEQPSKILKSHSDWIIGDYVYWLSIANSAKIGYIDEITTVHRYLNESASRTKDLNKMLNYIDIDFDIKLFFIKNSNTIGLQKKVITSFKKKILCNAVNYKNYYIINMKLKCYNIKYNFLDYLYILGSKYIIFWLLVKFIRYILPRYKY